MKTSHQLARELLELPERTIRVEMWGGETPIPQVTDWNEDGDFVEPGKGCVILAYERSHIDMKQFKIVNYVDTISFKR